MGKETMERIAIIGVGQTRQERNKVYDTFADMVFEATTRALKDAGIEISQIGNVVSASNDFWDGRTISSMAINDACGSYDKNISCVEGDGTFAAFYGMTRILSGSYDTTLVVAHCKGSESDSARITNAMFDPIYARSLGLDFVSSAALQARRYMDRYGITEEQCALVSVKNHGNALRNTFAQLPLRLTVEDVMQSRMLADPIKLLDASPISDGACAIILAREAAARKISSRPVWVRGVGYCADAYHLGDRDLADCQALFKASEKAYAMAGIRDPKKELDVVELYDAFTYQELLWTEGLGLCGRGEGGKLIESGDTQIAGPIPVNPSGGLLSAHTVTAAGLVRIAEAVLQLRGDAGERQVRGARTALAHGVNGPCGQSHCVWVLGN
ncbi:MAG: thiolase family protein [bacterium]